MAVDWDAEVLGPTMAEFGEEVIYTPRGGSPITIPDAVFDQQANVPVIGDDGMPTTIQHPVLGIRVSALDGVVPAQSDRVLISATGITYIVSNPEPDGHGHVYLTLMKAKS